MSDVCRWGILSTAEIGKKNWHALKLANNANLVAVASRVIDRAQDFIDGCHGSVPLNERPIPIAGYENLLQRDDIDAVYVPLPTGIRKQWVIAAARAGKHVLCEKPCALNASELREMIDVCRENRVQFMDGVMFMHTKRLQQMREVIDNQIGTLRRIQSVLTFCGDEEFRNRNIRTNSELEPHGCLGDLGWYNIRISLWAMNWELPRTVRARILTELGRADTDGSVPMSMSAEMEFDGQVSAGFYCSFQDHFQQWATIGGTKGFLQLEDFVLPFAEQPLKYSLCQPDFVVEECQFDMRERTTLFEAQESANNAPDSPETKMIEKFSTLVKTGIDPWWSDIAHKTQLVLDACIESARNNSAAVNVIKP